MCWAVGFALAGQHWSNGLEVLAMPGEVVSAILGGNLSVFKISVAGTLVSGLVAILYFTQGCFQMVFEITVANKLEDEAAR